MDKLNYIAENRLPIRDTSKIKREPSLMDAIQMIVDEHSGGIKFIELISELMMNYRNDPHFIEIFAASNELHDVVEMTIRDFGGRIKILDYTWQSMNRSKMFVYTE